MKRLLYATGLALFFITPAVHAEATDCAAAKTQADLATCTAKDAASADAALNAVYKALSGRLSSADEQRLRDAQRAWIPFRDKECAFRTQAYADGSVYSSLLETCRTDLTKARLAQLQHQLKCPEGDLSCVPQAAGAPKPATAAPAATAPAKQARTTRGHACNRPARRNPTNMSRNAFRCRRRPIHPATVRMRAA
ncbi:hypothetical protein AU467_17745 [Mesorhizobium loti]|uniref:Lysozyme inhibitor LprI-like N-terminal domain-containing protein n=1 Tax=Rhizobium loti TaxID=381 RepID=A0A101KU40_RHILI|nr:hypothetical protein AU467_17745 [Mesorhizobium loti]